MMERDKLDQEIQKTNLFSNENKELKLVVSRNEQRILNRDAELKTLDSFIDKLEAKIKELQAEVISKDLIIKENEANIQQLTKNKKPLHLHPLMRGITAGENDFLGAPNE
jgi:TolA-binding protein